MAKRTAKRGFLATWGLPLIAGPGITLAGLAYLDGVADPEFRAAVPEPIAAEVALRPSERFEPEPLGPPRSLPPAPAEPVNVYTRVVVLDSGRFRTTRDGRSVVIELAGIRPVPFDERCTDAEGVTWRCGGRARAELARLIGSRAVGCDPVDGRPDTVQRCQVAGRDLAGWLVSQGWAEPEDPADPELAPLHQDAKRQGRGRHGSAPLGVIAG